MKIERGVFVLVILFRSATCGGDDPKADETNADESNPEPLPCGIANNIQEVSKKLGEDFITKFEQAYNIISKAKAEFITVKDVFETFVQEQSSKLEESYGKSKTKIDKHIIKDGCSESNEELVEDIRLKMKNDYKSGISKLMRIRAKRSSDDGLVIYYGARIEDNLSDILTTTGIPQTDLTTNDDDLFQNTCKSIMPLFLDFVNRSLNSQINMQKQNVENEINLVSKKSSFEQDHSHLSEQFFKGLAATSTCERPQPTEYTWESVVAFFETNFINYLNKIENMVVEFTEDRRAHFNQYAVDNSGWLVAYKIIKKILHSAHEADENSLNDLIKAEAEAALSKALPHVTEEAIIKGEAINLLHICVNRVKQDKDDTIIHLLHTEKIVNAAIYFAGYTQYQLMIASGEFIKKHPKPSVMASLFSAVSWAHSAATRARGKTEAHATTTAPESAK